MLEMVAFQEKPEERSNVQNRLVRTTAQGEQIH